MLENNGYILHELINNIVPIDGVAYDEVADSYRVDYQSTPTQQQIDDVNLVISDWPITDAKIEKIKEIDVDLNTTLDAGWTTSYGWKLGLSTEHLRLLTAQFTEAKELDADGSTADISVIDTTYTPHNLSYSDFRTLILSYWSARRSIVDADSARRKVVEDATTLTQIDNA